MAAFEEAGSVLERPLHRPVTRTAPLVLDRGRISISVPGMSDRGFGQGSLVALMAVAFGALAVTRLGGGPVLQPAAGEPGATRSPAAVASSKASPAGTAVPQGTVAPTLVPSDGEAPTKAPSKTAAPAKTPKPTAKPATGGTGTTYKVQTGDTLSGIAAEHGTTWQAIAKLNKLDDPRRIRVGQVLVIP